MDLSRAVRDYTEAWNVDDPEARLALLRGALAPQVRFADRATDVVGWGGVAEVIGRFRARGSGLRFVADAPQAHHGRFRFAWRAVRADGSVAFQGTDYGDSDAEGRIASLTVFVD